MGQLQLYLALRTAGGGFQVNRPSGWVALGVSHQLVLVQWYQALRLGQQNASQGVNADAMCVHVPQLLATSAL